MSFDPENPFSEVNMSDPATMLMLFELEPYQMPPDGYCDKKNLAYFRDDAAQLIKNYAYSCACDPVVPYLAVNYFDNFYSTHLLPEKLGKWGDDTRLVATCCLVSAWKMRYAEFPMSDFLMVLKLDCLKPDDIVETETLIDRWLERRNCKRPVTALCFLDYFIAQLTELNEDQMKEHKRLATHKIYEQPYDVRFTEFRPSILAATAIVFSSSRLSVKKLKYVIETLMNCEHVYRESLLFAINMDIPNLKSLVELVSESDEASSPTPISFWVEPIPLPPLNIDNVAAEADNATTEASAEPNAAPKLESVDCELSLNTAMPILPSCAEPNAAPKLESVDCELSLNTAMPTLPSSLLPPRKVSVPAADQESAEEKSKRKGKRKMFE